MDFEVQDQGEADEIMAPREDLLGYDDDDMLEEEGDIAQRDAQSDQAADEEEGQFRCVFKTAVLADQNTPIWRLFPVSRTGCSSSNASTNSSIGFNARTATSNSKQLYKHLLLDAPDRVQAPYTQPASNVTAST